MEKKTVKENVVARNIMEYLKRVPRCFCWKEHGGMYGTAGIPDIICCISGDFFAFEVKTESGKTTKLQEATIRKITDASSGSARIKTGEKVLYYGTEKPAVYAVSEAESDPRKGAT